MKSTVRKLSPIEIFISNFKWFCDFPYEFKWVRRLLGGKWLRCSKEQVCGVQTEDGEPLVLSTIYWGRSLEDGFTLQNTERYSFFRQIE